MGKEFIYAKELYLEEEVLRAAYVGIEAGKIVSISTEVPEEEVSYYAEQLMPGFVDLHTHGNAGNDTMDGTYEAVNSMSQELASYGVTAFCPTTLTAPLEKIEKALINVADAKDKGVSGAEIIGTYVEGPYFTEKYKGAHPEDLFRRPSAKEIEHLYEIARGEIAVVAIAPETEGAEEAVLKAKELGIKVAMGHTDAGYETCRHMVNQGVSIGVHTFNGMRGLHHREPGTVGAILSDQRVYGEMICDGHHVHPAIMKVMYRCKGKEKMYLISDAMCATGMKDGSYMLGELEVDVVDSIARTKYGSLAGSTLKLVDGVFNLSEWAGIPLVEAVRMASLTPAEAVGRAGEMGSIAVGKKANLVAIEDRQVEQTWVGGKVVYSKGE